MENAEKVRAGINYIRLQNRGLSVPVIAEDTKETEEHVKECIKLARKHKDASELPPKVKFKEPHVNVFHDLVTGERQVVESVEVELLRDIIVKFSHLETSEFTTMLPVTIKIKRKLP